MSDTVYQALALIIPLVMAIVFHEVAHGWIARMLGDPTADERGRLSLNPLRHVDPMGTVIIPGFLALAHLPVFGWAKPVPVNARRMRDPRRGMMWTAAAGPGMNLAMALASAVLIGLLARAYGGQEPVGAGRFLVDNLVNFIQINVFLAFFNLLPIPPFDGSHILEGLLPLRLAQAYARLRRLGFMLVLIVLVLLPTISPAFNFVPSLVGPPVEWLLHFFGGIASAVAGKAV